MFCMFCNSGVAFAERLTELNGTIQSLKAEIPVEEAKLTARLSAAAKELGVAEAEGVNELTRCGTELSEAQCQRIFAQLAAAAAELNAFAKRSNQNQAEQELKVSISLEPSLLCVA
jgi:hypothetical protein